jgi:phosphoenolpyruvate carboxykinase (ATP)
MQDVEIIFSDHALEHHRLKNLKNVYWNLYPSFLIEQIILRREGHLAHRGAVVVNTGQHTGRSANDKFVVQREEEGINDIWWGEINQPIASEKFQQLYHKLAAYLQGREVFVQDMQAGAHPDYKVPIRIITEKAWHSLLAWELFIRVPVKQLAHHIPEFTVIVCPDFHADPIVDDTKSGTFIVIDFSERLVLIGGTSYGGEIKKSIFTVMNYLMPKQGVLSMHCAANIGKDDDVALFFGLSGTGKTTLSSDLKRRLIGDDEHGWSEDGVFNFEGGCYAKTYQLRKKFEPLIWSAVKRYGSVLENVAYDPISRKLNFDDNWFTENMRAVYPLSYVPNRVESGRGGHPRNIFFLTADAFGVMPPLASLTIDQAMYYFLSGYTSKLAGTEKALGMEPVATFSACFGSPFLPLHPNVYADIFRSKIKQHGVKVWLLNTGWTGGPYGVGERIDLPCTRAMVNAVLSGELDKIALRKDEVFGLYVPEECPDISSKLLDPKQTWDDQYEYKKAAISLAKRFQANILNYADQVSQEVIAAGPQVE